MNSSTSHPSLDAGTLPRVPVIDAHQHFWDLDTNYLPWLKDLPPIPFRYGNYDALRRNYLPDDYRRDSRGLTLVGSVFVETEWDRRDPVGETRWVQRIMEGHGLPSVMVCHAALHHDGIHDVLAEQASFKFVRGVRHKPQAAPSPDTIEHGARGSMTDPAWRKGYAALVRHDLSFDLQTPWWHLGDAVILNRDFPSTKIILNHTGLPRNRTDQELSHWRSAMQEFAAAPNVAVKISGLGEPGLPWTLERNRQVILDVIKMFGEDRCMFASNFPVDGLVASLATIYSGFSEATRTLGETVQTKLFADNARRIYRMAGR